jgi:predicted nucleotidyltransferase
MIPCALQPRFETTWNRFVPSSRVIWFEMPGFLVRPRGDDRDGSDLDILVEPTEVTTLFDLAGLKLELEALLGVRVDVATPGLCRRTSTKQSLTI